MNESILSVLQGEGDHDRVVLVHRQSFGKSEMLLRRESFSEDVGWFEQSTIELSTGQLGQLKQALGVLPTPKLRPHAQWSAAAKSTTGRHAGAPAAAGRELRFALVSQIAG